MRYAASHPLYGSASAHFSKADVMIYVGLLVAVVVVIYYGFSKFMDALKAVNPLKEVSKTLADTQVAATNAIIKGANSQNNSAVLTTKTYDDMIANAGWPMETVARVGNVITPPMVLEAAARAGSESAETVERLGLNDAYVDLALPAKALVTLGQGAGKAAGIDVIQMGYDMRSNIANSYKFFNNNTDGMRW